MTTSVASRSSPRHALRACASALVRAWREVASGVRQGVASVATARAENRAVLRSCCAAGEQVARTTRAIVQVFEVECVAAWRPLPLIGAPLAAIIRAIGWSIRGILSVVVLGLVACDILLNTARTERVT